MSGEHLQDHSSSGYDDVKVCVCTANVVLQFFCDIFSLRILFY